MKPTLTNLTVSLEAIETLLFYSERLDAILDAMLAQCTGPWPGGLAEALKQLSTAQKLSVLKDLLARIFSVLPDHLGSIKPVLKAASDACTVAEDIICTYVTQTKGLSSFEMSNAVIAMMEVAVKLQRVANNLAFDMMMANVQRNISAEETKEVDQKKGVYDA